MSGTPPWGPGRERLTLDPSQRQTRGDLTMARLWGGEEEGVRAAQGFGRRASEGRGAMGQIRGVVSCRTRSPLEA